MMNQFRELAVKTQALNEVTDKINVALVEFKEQLKVISPGVQTWVFVNDKKDCAIGYSRLDGEWTLVIRYGLESDITIVDALNARRDQRLLFYKKRQKLLDAIIEHVEILTKRMTKALLGEETKDEQE